jgi:dUTP pyrophosphatase
MTTRGFEIVSEYAAKQIELPVRKTAQSAGYDLAAAEDMVILPQQVTLIPTGLKAYMKQDEYLGLHIRSGFAIKNRITLINSQGIIDADYYNNPDNEGHIMIAVYNYQGSPVPVPKGTRIAQGIFYQYLLADHDDRNILQTRLGGFGSTGSS